MKNKNQRPFSLAFPSVVIAGPLLQSHDEAQSWATDLENGRIAENFVPTAVGRGCGYSQFSQDVYDLHADEIDRQSGVRIDSFHRLLRIRETDDGWIPHVQVGILAAAPMRELRHRASGVLVAGPLRETTIEAHSWFNGLDDDTRFYPMAIGSDVGDYGGIREMIGSRASILRGVEGVDLINGITASKRRAYRTIRVPGGWTSVFEANVQYAKVEAASTNSSVFLLDPAAAIH